MPSPDARIEQFRFYQTRCNICGTKRTEPGYVLDMILLKRLWLPRVATLDDAFEGALGAKTRHPEWQKWLYDFFVAAVKNPPPEYQGNISDQYAHQEPTRLLSEAETTLAKQKRETYVSCWHIANHESFLMWKVYANNRPDS